MKLCGKIHSQSTDEYKKDRERERINVKKKLFHSTGDRKDLKLLLQRIRTSLRL